MKYWKKHLHVHLWWYNLRFVSNCNSDQTYTACFQDSTLIRLDYFNAWTTKLNATWNLHDRSLTWGRIINNAAVFRGIWCDFVLAQGQVEWKVGFIVTQSHNQVCSFINTVIMPFLSIIQFFDKFRKMAIQQIYICQKAFSPKTYLHYAKLVKGISKCIGWDVVAASDIDASNVIAYKTTERLLRLLFLSCPEE